MTRIRRILHVDMDAFYASVEQRDRPEFQGLPVIVGADPKNGAGRGVVAACSYEARRFGIHSALPISQAWRLCREGIYLRPRMTRYQQVSKRIMAIFREYTDLVEPLSLDEAFLDVTGSTMLIGPAEEIARIIKREIKNQVGLTASVGIAPNKFLAKIASDLRKPDGLVLVRSGEEADFVRDLPITKLWGVGPKTARRLQRLGMETIGDLAAMSLPEVKEAVGGIGEHFWSLARGRDDRHVVADWRPKSLSSERTFEQDTRDSARLVDTLRQLSDQVAKRLRQKDYRARTIVLKLRYKSFETHTRQTSLREAINTGDEIFSLIRGMFHDLRSDESVRLLGVAASNLIPEGRRTAQMELFETRPRTEKLARLLDEVHERYGAGSLHKGSDLG